MTPDVELSGYAEVRSAFQIGSDGTPWSLQERVRPILQAAPAERMRVEVVVEGALKQGRNDGVEAYNLVMDSELGDFLEQSGCNRILPYQSAAEYLSVERLRLDFNLPHVDLKIGRQAVAWGSSLVVHPTDPFPEVVALDPGKERQGINAVRAEVPLGNHSVGGMLAVDDNLSPFYADEIVVEDLPLTGAVKATLRAFEADFSAVGWGRPDGQWFAGADIKGTLGVGYWVEGGWHGEAEAPEVVVGLDYSFPVGRNLYLAAEYRYDGTGEAPEDYDWSSRSVATSLPVSCDIPAETGGGSRFTLGQHYAHGILNWAMNDTWSASGAAIVNLQDGTGILVPDVAMVAGSRVAIHVGAQVPFGDEGEFRPPASALTTEILDVPLNFSKLLYDANLQGWLRYSF